MPLVRRPLRTARQLGVHAYVEDTQGTRTLVSLADYEAHGRGERVIPGAVRGGDTPRWNTPSGDFEPDTIHVLEDGRRLLCVGTAFEEERSKRRNERGEVEVIVTARRPVLDLLAAPEGWELGTHPLRPGLQIVDGQIERDEPGPPPPAGPGR